MDGNGEVLDPSEWGEEGENENIPPRDGAQRGKPLNRLKARGGNRGTTAERQVDHTAHRLSGNAPSRN